MIQLRDDHAGVASENSICKSLQCFFSTLLFRFDVTLQRWVTPETSGRIKLINNEPSTAVCNFVQQLVLPTSHARDFPAPVHLLPSVCP